MILLQVLSAQLVKSRIGKTVNITSDSCVVHDSDDKKGEQGYLLVRSSFLIGIVEQRVGSTLFSC